MLKTLFNPDLTCPVKSIFDISPGSGKKIFFVLTIALLLSSPCLAGEWNLTGSLNQGRECFCSVMLDDGKVLVAGGYYSGALSSCEIYDSDTGEWSTTDSMNYARMNFSLTKLSNGKILATAGNGGSIYSEVFNPETETWSEIATLNYPRHYHSAVLLQNGKVLVVGGDNANDYKGCEIYNPQTNEWTLTGFCSYPKLWHTLELLSDGRVMVIGGGNSSYEHCEIYDPDTELWTVIDDLNEQRFSHTSHLLPNGNVMAIAGCHGNHYNSSCEIYDFQTEEWSFTDSLEIGRTNHCSETLLNTKTLVMGGWNNGYLSSCEIYDWQIGEWEPETPMPHLRANFCSETLIDEKVLAIGPYYCDTYTWNYQPTVSQPQGSSQAVIGEILTFSVTATDPDGDSIAVCINWGNGEISEWTELQPSGTTFELSHAWLEPGQYEVCAQTADKWFFLNELCHNSISCWTDPLIITIFGIPQIEVSTDSLNFGTVYIGSDSTKTITISNLGNGILEAELLTNTDEFSVSPSNFNLEPGENIDIEVTFAPSYEGIITDTLTILSNDPENPEVEIALVGEGEILVGVDNNEIFTNSIRIYPNPFNKSTTIYFSATDIHRLKKIIIYNVKGQKVRTFPNLQINKSSNQQIIWNGTDDNNQPVGSGIYFYKLVIDGKPKFNRKMLLLK